MMNNQKPGMHADDKKNLIIFAVACIGLFILYDIFIYQPKMAEIRAAQELAATEAVRNPDAHTSSAPKLLGRAEVVSGSGRLNIETETLSGSMSLTGARIDDLLLKQYMTEPGGDIPVTLLNPQNVAHGYFGEFGWVTNDQSIRVPDAKTRWFADKSIIRAGEAVMLSWNNGQGLTFRKEITLDENYMFSVIQSVENRTRRSITLYPFAKIGRNGMPADMTGAFILHEGPIGYVDGELFEVDYNQLDDQDNETARGNSGWIGFTDKYWLTALTTGKEYREDTKYRFVGQPSRSGVTYYQTDMMGAAMVLNPGEEKSIPIEFFAGPKIVSMLEDYADQYDIPHFDLAVDFGIFYFLTYPFYKALGMLNALFGSFAISLLVFTIIIKTITFYLFGKRAFRSFARMRKVSPQMLEIREKCGDDREQLQKALFELYKKENVNPVAGCVPLLLQIPIFFALYKVFYVSIEMRHEPFWGWIADMSVYDPTNLFEGFGLLPWDAPGWLHIGIWPILMGLSMALLQRLSPPPQDQTQRIVFGIMPFWITILLAKFPAGLVIYWTWSNLISVFQQYLMLREEGVKVNIITRTRTEKKLEEMVKEGVDKPSDLDIIDHDDIEPETKKAVKPKKRKKKKK